MGAWGPDVLGEGFEARTIPLAPALPAEEDAPPDTAPPDTAPPDTAPDAVPDAPSEVEPEVATIVRYRPERAEYAEGTAGGPRAQRRFVVLLLHGWNDYFFHWETAELIDALGGTLYALDLRGYGRSLREHSLPGYIDDLARYTEEIDAAWAIIREEVGDVPRILAGHSTGGLVASLWAADHPGQLVGLALNSPWLESIPLRGLARATVSVLRTLTRGNPRRPVVVPGDSRYAESLAGVELPPEIAGHTGTLPSEDAVVAGGAAAAGDPLLGDGADEGDLADDPFHRGWDLEPQWRSASAPIYAGWVAAVLRGQARVAEGLDLSCPVLVVTAARSTLGLGGTLRAAVDDVLHPRTRPAASSADIVLDVPAMRRRALDLGPRVTLVAVDGAIHDVMASARPARRFAQREVRRWLRGILDDDHILPGDRTPGREPRPTPSTGAPQSVSGP